jgi:hypothetical protein
LNREVTVKRTMYSSGKPVPFAVELPKQKIVSRRKLEK